MESISIIKGATTVKKEAKKVQRQKSFFLLKYNMLLFSVVLVLVYVLLDLFLHAVLILCLYAYVRILSRFHPKYPKYPNRLLCRCFSKLKE